MTRLSLARCCLILLSPAIAAAQTGPTQGGSRYAPPAGAARGPAPAAQGAPYPARQANEVQPVRQPIGQPGVAGPGPAVQPAIAPAMPQPPEWAGRMSPEEQKWIDDVLTYWEARSDKVKLYECKFQRWDYDGGFAGQ